MIQEGMNSPWIKSTEPESIRLFSSKLIPARRSPIGNSERLPTDQLRTPGEPAAKRRQQYIIATFQLAGTVQFIQADTD